MSKSLEEILLALPGLSEQKTGFFTCPQELQNREYDFLIFVDSRGQSGALTPNASWAMRYVNFLEEKGLTCLYVARPKEMTCFFTLLNFYHFFFL